MVRIFDEALIGLPVEQNVPVEVRHPEIVHQPQKIFAVLAVLEACHNCQSLRLRVEPSGAHAFPEALIPDNVPVIVAEGDIARRRAVQLHNVARQSPVGSGCPLDRVDGDVFGKTSRAEFHLSGAGRAAFHQNLETVSGLLVEELERGHVRAGPAFLQGGRGGGAAFVGTLPIPDAITAVLPEIERYLCAEGVVLRGHGDLLRPEGEAVLFTGTSLQHENGRKDAVRSKIHQISSDKLLPRSADSSLCRSRRSSTESLSVRLHFP